MITRTFAPSVAALALLLAGCSQSGGVSQKTLEDEVSKQLEATVGQAPDAIDCPGDLKAEVGTTMRCTLTAGEDELGLTVTVTEVKGKDVDFDIEVDQQ